MLRFFFNELKPTQKVQTYRASLSLTSTEVNLLVRLLVAYAF